MQLLTVTRMLLVLIDKGKGMQSSSEQPLVGEEHCVTTLITVAKETNVVSAIVFQINTACSCCTSY